MLIDHRHFPVVQWLVWFTRISSENGVIIKEQDVGICRSIIGIFRWFNVWSGLPVYHQKMGSVIIGNMYFSIGGSLGNMYFSLVAFGFFSWLYFWPLAFREPLSWRSFTLWLAYATLDSLKRWEQ